MMDLELKSPVTLAGSTVTRLTFRDRVVAGDMRGLKVSSFEDPTCDELLKIAGRLCAQPDAVMNALGLADMAEVIKLVSVFLVSGLETGNTPSP